MLRIADDADDLGRPSPERDALAERVFIREILPRQRFVDNDDVALLADLLFGEESPACSRDLQRTEEVLIGDTKACSGHPLTGRRLRTTFDLKDGLCAQSEEGRMVDGARGLDSG